MIANFTRRAFLATASSALATPMLAASNPALPAALHPKKVGLQVDVEPYQIHVETGLFRLYWTLPDNEAIRFPVGVAYSARHVTGTFKIRRKAKWPSWTPTRNMIRREPELYAKYASGIKGGDPLNPLGSRALYLYRGNRDSLLRIHGTNRPEDVGKRVSNGCIRMVNSHVAYLYEQVKNGTEVFIY
ncbi:L,D-transpeptidase [Nereida sp. MMG025]|uniref:L,D-transpeptidase n=1 Tax=Nereida sp. MMG025 TaxID=2909981 RepID=UPI001F3451F2|nr:L,D-transpeptidase [Nereida sp. MMG025]MCF6444828.1 L,D-transpeptidase [Nereida sp. MMG025]